MDVTFRFNITKATDVACWFIRREGGQINIMKLVKLVYLLDRLAVERRGKPIVGGVYFSMRNGPVTSELLDLINSGELQGETDNRWSQLVSDRRNHDVALEGQPSLDSLSPAEVDLMEALYNEHGSKTQFQLRDWCHTHCAEWTPLDSGRAPIPIEEVAKNVGCDADEVKSIASFAKESNLLRSFLKLA